MSRTIILLRSARRQALLNGHSNLQLSPSIASLVTLRPLRNYSTANPSTPRTLKPSTFAQPNVGGTSGSQPSLSLNNNISSVPQQDIDDFNITKLIHGQTDLQIAITSRASQKLTNIAKDDKNPRTALKINVESGGCHGFQYNLVLSDLDKEIALAKEEDQEDELLVFQRKEAGQTAFVILDESSLQILQDSKIDFTKELIGSSFKVVDSPYTSTACGCGASFDFDFEKLEQKMKEKEQK
ncbi:hypothetical protein CLIB1423_01S12244 [[Candida] railenensis]|uniref:Core domain-containing protein n=1 Tax=[Candida] railenensis TaxID=45579 RepID=A0A9P0VWJ9_9ASCO|nr:hypothetical protein CLIB1423_01S12244 [[Candida] railenensis]